MPYILTMKKETVVYCSFTVVAIVSVIIASGSIEGSVLDLSAGSVLGLAFIVLSAIGIACGVMLLTGNDWARFLLNADSQLMLVVGIVWLIIRYSDGWNDPYAISCGIWMILYYFAGVLCLKASDIDGRRSGTHNSP